MSKAITPIDSIANFIEFVLESLRHLTLRVVLRKVFHVFDEFVTDFIDLVDVHVHSAGLHQNRVDSRAEFEPIFSLTVIKNRYVSLYVFCVEKYLVTAPMTP